MPFPTPGDLLDPGIKPVSLVLPALAGRFLTTSPTWEEVIGMNSQTKPNMSIFASNKDKFLDKSEL